MLRAIVLVLKFELKSRANRLEVEKEEQITMQVTQLVSAGSCEVCNCRTDKIDSENRVEKSQLFQARYQCLRNNICWFYVLFICSFVIANFLHPTLFSPSPFLPAPALVPMSVDSANGDGDEDYSHDVIDQESHPFLEFNGIANLSWFAFLIVAVASSRLGTIFPRMGLPLITGYMIVGCICGPYALGLVTKQQIPDLSYVTQIALAFIAYSAGSELYLPELRSLFKPILWITAMNAGVTYIFCTLFIYGLGSGGVIPWMKDYSSGCLASISLVAGSIMVARSPASAIAVVRELRAKGKRPRHMI